MLPSTWERIATHYGGTVAGLAEFTNDMDQRLVFAATPVGVYRSTDAGLRWSQPGVSPTVPLADLVAVSPHFGRDRTLFACGVDGLHRSSDGGDTWQRVLVGSRMLAVTIAAGTTHDGLVVFAGTEADGILRSEDSGRTWSGANAGLLDLTAICLAVSPCFESDRTGFAGTASGLYRTRNGGRAWRAVETGLEEPAVQCLAVSPNFAEDRLVLAGTEADGLLRSTDGGATWHRPGGLAEGGVAAVAFDSAGRTVAAATESGIAVSVDNGNSWQIRPMPSRQPALSVVFSGQALLVGLHRDGVARSEDLGATWQTANEGLGARLDTELVLSPDFAHDRTLFLAGPEDGLRVSSDGGVTWHASPGGLTDVSAHRGAGDLGLTGLSVHGVAVSAAYASDRTVYLATSGGIRVSRDGGRSWHTSGGPTGSAKVVASGPGVVVAAVEGGRLLTSADGASTWHTLAAPLDETETIALAVSPTYAQDRTMFAVTTAASETVVWRSTDGGQAWHRWLIELASRVARVPMVVASTYALDGAMFVGLGRRVFRPVRHAQEVRAGERRPMWQSAEVGPDVVGVTALTVSPAYATDRTVFAATNAGVFVSRNGGERFEPWNEGLHPARMVSVAVSPAYPHDRLVYALGLGGAVWRRA